MECQQTEPFRAIKEDLAYRVMTILGRNYKHYLIYYKNITITYIHLLLIIFSKLTQEKDVSFKYVYLEEYITVCTIYKI